MVFQDFSVEQSPDDNLEVWLYPAIFDTRGERVQLRGPISTQELGRRRKIRFIQITFYELRYDNEKKHVPERTHAEWAWQGENQMMHLITDSRVLAHDPMGDNITPQYLDDYDRRVQSLYRGLLNSWDVEA